MSKRSTKIIITATALIGGGLLGLLAGCANTLQGAGEDTRRAGDKIDRAFHGDRDNRYTDNYRYGSSTDTPYPDAQ